MMPFAPRVHEPVATDSSLFQPDPMKIRDGFLDMHIDDRISYDREEVALHLTEKLA